MLTAEASRTQRIGVALVWLALAALALALAAATGARFRYDTFGLRISLSNPVRPLILSLVLAAAGTWLAGRERAAMVFAPWQRTLSTHAATIAAVFAILIGIVTFERGAHVAGGADASGYVSQSKLWLRGSLTLPTPLSREITVANGQYAFTPLGYRPAGALGTAVPGYPAGLPLLMAAAQAIGGDGAEYVVVPICAAGLVFVTFLLARRIGGSIAGLIAAAAVGTAPTFLFQAVQPMSDVPASCFWTLAILLLTFEQSGLTFAAGVAAAVACVVRPNLFALAPVVLAAAVWWLESRRRVLRVMLFVGPLSAAGAFVVLLQRSLYGSATTTGYGSLPGLFSLDHVVANLQTYPFWLVSTQSVLVLLAFLGPVEIRRGRVDPAIDRATAVRVAWSGVLVFAALLGFYLLYIVFDTWVYLRFLLPALPWFLVLFAIAVVSLCRYAPEPVQGAALVLALVLVAGWGAERARSLGAFRVGPIEQRHFDAAQFARGLRSTPVFVALQHSGSLNYYASAQVLRWDWIEPTEIDRAVAELAAKGRQSYAVLDDWEEVQFRDRFPATHAVEQLEHPVFTAGLPDGILVRIYALTGTTAAASRAPFSSPPLPAPRSRSRRAAPDPALSLASSRR